MLLFKNTIIMANLNKALSPKTGEFMRQINNIIENYIANQSYKSNGKKYTKGQFCADVGVSRSVVSVLTHKEFDNSITLDTALRLLHGCGMTLKITPEVMPKEMYMHKDIIMPSCYEKHS